MRPSASAWPTAPDPRIPMFFMGAGWHGLRESDTAPASLAVRGELRRKHRDDLLAFRFASARGDRGARRPLAGIRRGDERAAHHQTGACAARSAAAAAGAGAAAGPGAAAAAATRAPSAAARRALRIAHGRLALERGAFAGLAAHRLALHELRQAHRLDAVDAFVAVPAEHNRRWAHPAVG